MIGLTISHYKILEKLGEGGMGVVYKAEDAKLERTVALKFLSLTSIGDEDKKRFKREAKAAAALNHPNIATIFAIDEVDGQLFIAMEFIDGQSLRERVDAGPLKIATAIDFAIQIAEGLQAAHEKGVVHRDVKSANIMVTDKEQVKIMDFGLAKLADRSMLTKEGTTLGTVAYMSPEQAQSETVDRRTDVWSLGVVLYEMVTGRLPFTGEYEQAIIYSLINEEPAPLTALRTGVPLALDGIMAKALAKDPATRYQNVEELPADLKGIAVNSTGVSHIEKTNTAGEAIPRRTHRVRLLWIATVMTVIGLLAGGLIFKRNVEYDPPNPMYLPLAIPSDVRIAEDDDDPNLALSPDGRRLVYVGETDGVFQLYLQDLTQPDRLLAMPFDPDRPESHKQLMVLDNVMTDSPNLSARYATSRSGSLVYVSGPSEFEDSLIRIDRGGTRRPLTPELRNFELIRFSPDGRFLAMQIIKPKAWDIWVFNLLRKDFNHFTLDPAYDDNPVWTPDSRRIIFSTERKGGRDLFWKPIDGSGLAEPLLIDKNDKRPTSCSSDGRLLAFERQNTETGVDIMICPIDKPDTSIPFLATRFNEKGAMFSPNGRWITYQSDESGQWEIYVRPFPGPGSKWKVSTNGGQQPRWQADGEEIFYRENRKAMVAKVQVGSNFSTSVPEALFDGLGDYYDVSPDGAFFVTVTRKEKPRLILVLNWFEELKRKVPGGKP